MSPTIRRPGIHVCGSHAEHVEPDSVSLEFRVTRIDPRPSKALSEARDAARAVRRRLSSLGVCDGDVRMRALSLAGERGHRDGLPMLVGYRASVGFRVVHRDLARVDALVDGVVEAGADRVDELAFHLTRMREIRGQARRHALDHARSKAERLAASAGVGVGGVLSIEDVSPADELGGGASRVHLESDYLASAAQRDPGSVVVSASLMVCFAILH